MITINNYKYYLSMYFGIQKICILLIFIFQYNMYYHYY